MSVRQVMLYQDTNGCWIAEVPGLPGCHSDGNTYHEAAGNIKAAIRLYLESLIARGVDIPDDPRTAQIVEL